MYIVSNEDDLNWKTTSKNEISSISATTGRILIKFESQAKGTEANCTKVSNEDNLHRKTSSNAKCKISQQPLVGSYSNVKLKLRGPNKLYKSLK